MYKNCSWYSTLALPFFNFSGVGVGLSDDLLLSSLDLSTNTINDYQNLFGFIKENAHTKISHSLFFTLYWKRNDEAYTDSRYG